MPYFLFKYRLNKSDVSAVDKAMTVAATIHPMTALPQVITIYAAKSATDVSLLTWLCFMLLGVIFLVYALVHRIKPLILNQVLWFAVDFLVVAGILMYGNK